MKSIKILVLLMFSHSSLADVIDITADYKPESYEVSGGRFINTTPCDVGQPTSYCDPQKPLESSVIVKLPASVEKTINSAKGKQNYLSYYRLSGPKKVTLTNSNNGERHELTFIPTNIGVMVRKMAYPIVDGNKWPMSSISGDCYDGFKTWSWPSGPVVTGQLFLYSVNDVAQNGPSECYYNSQLGDGTSYTIDWLNYGFRIKAPNPLTMSNGNYTGGLKIMVGRNKDIDLGDAMYSGGTEHEFKFTLTVRHQLKVDFYEGGENNQVHLLPPGGWSSLNYGKNISPRRLQSDLNFRIWFSAKFYMILRCQYLWADSGECALKDSQGRTVPLNTYYVDSDNKMSLLFYHRYQPISPKQQGTPEINAARAIRFQVVGDTVTEMMKYPGSSFKGDVTLIFDAAID